MTPDDTPAIGPKPTYLGDGVYASFDGYQVWLSVNDHRNQVVALDPGVAINLLRYFNVAFPPKPQEPSPKKIGFAPGNYTCTCLYCGMQFEGDKRSWQCKGCAALKDSEQ